MHPTAYEFAKKFYNTYCNSLSDTATIVDFGSYDQNGTLKPIFAKHKYIGIDMCEGPNVDIVCNNSDTPLESNSVDVIVSSSCFEHDECFWQTFLEMCRIVKEGGYIYINAPSAGAYHGFPGDCWRFYKDSWTALAKWANKQGYPVECIYSYVDQEGYWKDSIGVFRKSTLNSS
jgi:SAM-dependent methyltransferase